MVQEPSAVDMWASDIANLQGRLTPRGNGTHRSLGGSLTPRGGGGGYTPRGTYVRTPREYDPAFTAVPGNHPCSELELGVQRSHRQYVEEDMNPHLVAGPSGRTCFAVGGGAPPLSQRSYPGNMSHRSAYGMAPLQQQQLETHRQMLALQAMQQQHLQAQAMAMAAAQQMAMHGHDTSQLDIGQQTAAFQQELQLQQAAAVQQQALQQLAMHQQYAAGMASQRQMAANAAAVGQLSDRAVPANEHYVYAQAGPLPSPSPSTGSPVPCTPQQVAVDLDNEWPDVDDMGETGSSPGAGASPPVQSSASRQPGAGEATLYV